jgi:anti-sigma factor RsiW
MNQPRESQHSGVVALKNLLDRLVDGELPDRERSALILQLETEPNGWRHCALAFLEAQSWQQALAPMAAERAADPLAPVQPRRRLAPRWRFAARLTGLAASLLATFALGWTLHGGSGSIAEGDQLPTLAHSDRHVSPVESRQPALYTQVQPDALDSPSTGQPAALAPVIKEWQQLGYQAETQMRLASLKLKDGTHVEVPVHEVRLHYVRDRTY